MAGEMPIDPSHIIHSLYRIAASIGCTEDRTSQNGRDSIGDSTDACRDSIVGRDLKGPEITQISLEIQPLFGDFGANLAMKRTPTCVISTQNVEN